MMKILRVAVVILVLHMLAPAGLGAKESYCRVALQRCLVQCDQYPSLVREGCKVGCGIGYLNCD